MTRRRKIHLRPASRPPVPPDPRHLAVCRADGHFVRHLNPAEISDLIARPGQFVWLDIQDPQESDAALLKEEFGFHPLAIEDAVRHQERPKVDTYEGYYLLVFYALGYDTAHNRLVTQPMNLFIGANYIVSVHHGPLKVIEETIGRWQRNEEGIGWDAGALLYALLDAIVDDYFPVIDQLAERVERIEEQIFERFRPEALQEVFVLKRDLLGVRRIVAPERDVLNVLIRREVPIFNPASVVFLQDVYDHLIRVTDSLDTYRDLLSSALDAFLSIQSNQLNEVVKVLTIASIVLMSDALIAGIYGMNFQFMPELSWPYGYPFALGLMAVVSAGLVAYFRWRKWL
ncbi:MAG TPA: magnesium/cobalt transporter CorA [Roseiflexaceae bacterium]|nr:magnesium/cobalt transporter CorA [Roseiflexaceae bacterium]